MQERHHMLDEITWYLQKSGDKLNSLAYVMAKWSLQQILFKISFVTTLLMIKLHSYFLKQTIKCSQCCRKRHWKHILKEKYKDVLFLFGYCFSPKRFLLHWMGLTCWLVKCIVGINNKSLPRWQWSLWYKTPVVCSQGQNL